MTKAKRICLILSLLTIVGGTGAGAYYYYEQQTGAKGELPPQLEQKEEGESYTLQAEPPTEGKPTDYNGLENISFMAYKLAHAQSFRTEAESNVNTTIGFISYVQNIKTYKDYADGVMVVEDITKSSLVNSALQTCFVNNRTLWRDPSSSRPTDWKGKETAWKNDRPANYSVSDYIKIYGLPSTEFCVYVLNEETLTNWSAVTDNGDGTYTQTVYPDVSTSSAYYAVRMKTMGGLSSYPTFYSIALTYTFDENWTVLSCETTEDYAVDLGLLHADHCKTLTKQKYYYDEAGVDISDYYEFFSRYVEKKSDGNVEEELKKELTAVDCLSAAFGEIMVEPKELTLEADFVGKELDGRVYVDLENMDIRARLAELNLWFAEEKIYLALADGMTCLSVNDLTSLINGGENTEAANDPFASLDFDRLLEELGGGEFVVSDMGATLEANLTFGEVVLPLHFSFLIDEEGNVSLDYAELKEFAVAGKTLSLQLRFGEELTLPQLSEESKSAAGDLMTVIDTVKETVEVVKSKEFSLSLAVETDTPFDLGLTVTGEEAYLSVSYYPDETDVNYAPLLLKGNLTELSALLDTVKKVSGYEIPFAEELIASLLPTQEGAGLEEKLSAVDWLHPSSWLTSFSLEENVLRISLNGEGLGLSADVDFSAEKGEGTLSAELSFGTLKLSGTLGDLRGTATPPQGEHIDVSSLDGAVNALLNSFFSVEENILSPLEEYHLGGKIGCSIGGYTLDFDLGINVDCRDGLKLNLSLGADSKFAVNSGRYLSYVTYVADKDMIYMQRYQYEYYSILSFKQYAEPVITYRAMTLQEFADDYWNQITYLTNMGDTVANLIKNQIDKPAEPGEEVLHDVGSYLKNYGYNEETREYSLALNGKNFADFLGDMSLIFQVNDENKITRIYGSVDIYVTLSVDLEYETVTKGGDYALTKTDLSAEWLALGAKENYGMTITPGHISSENTLEGVAEYVSIIKLQNGDTMSELKVVYGQPLSELPVLENTDFAQFMGWYTGETDGEEITQATVDNGLGGKTLYARWTEYVAIALDAGEGTASAGQVKAIPDELFAALKEVSVDRAGYAFVCWTDADGTEITEENIRLYAGGTIFASYKQVTYITFRSDIPYSIEGEEESTEYTTEWKGESSVLPVPKAAGYLFFGWALYTDEGYALLTAEKATASTEDMQAYALWITDDLSVSITESSSKKSWLGYYNWNISGTYAGGAFASGQSEEIAVALGAMTSAKALYRLSDDGETVKDTLNSGKSVDISGGVFGKTGMTSMKDAAYVGVQIEITYTLGDVSVTLTTTVWKQK